MVNNLYSLVNGKFYIENGYAHAQLPLLLNILNGKIELKAPTNPVSDTIVANGNTYSSTEETTKDEKYVAIVGIKHPIYKYSQFCGPRGTKTLQKRLENYSKDSNCLGVVMDIDSGGGQVSGTPEFFDYVKSYDKPIVSYTDGLMCSAAYYIASSSDYIVGNKRLDAVGSIGVMISFLDPTGMYVKKGAKMITEYADQSTDKNAAFEELLQGNPEKYIKEQLNPLAEQFHEDVLSVRPNLNKKVLKGGVYNADKSLENNLIDEIGTLKTAIDKVINISKINTTTNMSNKKKEFPKLQTALGMNEPFEDTANVYLQETQLEELEQNLEAQATAVTTAEQATADVQTELDTANSNLATANTTATSIEDVLNTACTEHEVENHANLSTVEKINALSGLVKEYGQNDGAGKTTPPAGNGGAGNPSNKNLTATQKLQGTIDNL